MKPHRFISHFNDTILDPIRRGRPGAALDPLRRRVHSDTYYWGLKRDLSVNFEASPAKIPISVRRVNSADIESITRVQNVPEDERHQLARRIHFLQEGVQTCFVAASETGEPTYIQWLFGSVDNKFIQANFHGLFPLLKSDEALLEYAFTFPDYRGFKIMPQAMDLIARQGAEIGARYVITFVSNYNVPALKGCERAGFSPYIVVRDRWRMFRRKVDFLELSEGPAYPLKD